MSDINTAAVATMKDDFIDSAKKIAGAIKSVLDAGKETKGVTEALKSVSDTGKKTKGIMEQITAKMTETFGAAKLFGQAMKAIETAVKDAVTQFDAMNRFPEVLSQLGYSAGEAANTAERLSQEIGGLPTSLDSIMANAQKLTTITGNLEMATDTALALNNAFLIGGAASGEASQGMQAYMDMLSAGGVNAESWIILQETMGVALKKTAEAFGFTGASAERDLYAALREGEVTFADFNSKIHDLNGGVGGFAEMAQAAVGGIGSAWTGMGSSVTRGMTGVVGAIDSGLSAFGGISGVIASFGGTVEHILSGIVAPALGLLTSNLDKIIPVAATFLALWAVNSFATFVTNAGGMMQALNSITTALDAATLAKMRDGAQTAYLNALYLKDAVVKGVSTAATNGNVAAIIASGVASKIAAAAQWLWNAAMSANPIALVIVGVVALAAAIGGLVSWLGQGSEANKAAGETIEEYKEKNDELKNSLEETKGSYRDNDAAAQANATTVRGMAASLQDAADSYDGSAESARKMQAKVQMLNESCAGLNVTFDEETGKLSQTADQMEAYISATEQAAKQTALKDHMTELNQQMADTQAEMIKAEMEIEKWGQQVAAGELDEKDFIKRKEEMEVTIGELSATMGETSEEMAQYEQKLGEIQAEEQKARQELLKQQEGDIRALADEYHMSYDNIIADMEKEGIGFAEWSIKKQEMLDENKAAVEGYAAQWGVSTGLIQAECADQNMTVDEWAGAMQSKMDEACSGILDTYGTMTSGLSSLSQEIVLDTGRLWENVSAIQDDTLPKAERFSELYGHFIKEGISESYLEAIGANKAEAIPLLESMMNEGIEVIKEAEADWQGAYNNIAGNSLTGVFEMDEETAAAIQNFVTGESGIYGNIVSAVEGVNFSGLMDKPLNGLADTVANNTAVAESGQQMLNNMKEHIGMADFSYMTGNIETEFATAFTGAATTVQTQTGVMATDVNTNMDGILEAIQLALTNAETALTSSLARMKTAVADKMSVILATAKTGFNNIVAAANISSRMYQSGGNAIQGFNDGMWSKAWKVYESARLIATNVANTINRALDVRSPSRVLRKSGQYTMQGFDLGMQDMAGGIFATVRGIAGMVTNEMQGLAGSAGGIDAVYKVQSNYSDTTTTGLLEKLLSAVEGGKVIQLDTGALVGATAGAYDVSLGNTKKYSERWRR